jgi:hypothetical protein
MSDDSGSGLSRRQVIAAGTTGLIAATAAEPSRAAARGRQGPGDGTPEQIHLTWGDDPPRSVVVSWASAGRADRPRVRIGQRVIAATERACGDPRSGGVTWTYHAHVDGLRPGATYGYAVTADNDASAADPFSATFTTAPDGRAAFRFTCFGDLGTARAGMCLEHGQAAYAAGAVETFQPLFHLDNGDLTPASPAPGALAQAWQDFGNNVQASAANRPWLPVPGSHALGLGHGEQGLASFLARYAVPANGMGGLEGRWYAFRVGTVLFVCLSGDDVASHDVAGPGGDGPAAVPGSGRGYSGGAQTRWLESTLAAARGDASLDWVVAAVHQCACSSATAGIGPDLGIREEWLPLFDTYEVDLVLAGHDHGYERSFPVRGQDDVGRPHPVTTVDSGVFDADGAAWSARRDASPGYGIAVFDVNPGSEAGGQTSITVRYYHDYRASGPDPVSPVAGEPAGDYAFFEMFTLVRPRSDGRRWHPRA